MRTFLGRPGSGSPLLGLQGVPVLAPDAEEHQDEAHRHRAPPLERVGLVGAEAGVRALQPGSTRRVLALRRLLTVQHDVGPEQVRPVELAACLAEVDAGELPGRQVVTEGRLRRAQPAGDGHLARGIRRDLRPRLARSSR